MKVSGVYRSRKETEKELLSRDQELDTERGNYIKINFGY